MKKVLFGIAAILAIAMMTGPAYAGTLTGMDTTVAAESFNAGAAVLANGIVPQYQLGAGALLNGTVLSATLTNAKWNSGTTYKLCDLLGAEVGTGTATDTLDLTLGAAIQNPNWYTIQQGACAAVPNKVVNVSVTSGNVGDKATLKISLKATPANGDVLATATVATVAKQFNVSVLPVTSKISFTKNMTTFTAEGAAVPRTTTDESLAGLVLTSDETIANKVATGASTADTNCVGALAAADSLKVKFTGNLSGLASFVYNGLAGATKAIVADDVTAGNVTLTIPGNLLTICQAKITDTTKLNISLSAKAKGSGLTADQLKTTAMIAQATLAVGGYSKDQLAANTTSHSFKLDATLADIPYLHTAEVMPSYCLINNFSDQAGDVTFDVLSSETTGVAGNYALGTIPAGASALATFNGQSVSLAGGNTVTLTVPANTRYSGRISVSAPPNKLTINCIQADPAGAKRLTPVLLEQTNAPSMW